MFGSILSVLGIIVYHMSPEIGATEIEPIDAVPEHATVRHYDEFDGGIKDGFPKFVADGSLSRTGQDAGTALDNSDCEVVKFTDYYHIVRGAC